MVQVDFSPKTPRPQYVGPKIFDGWNSGPKSYTRWHFVAEEWKGRQMVEEMGGLARQEGSDVVCESVAEQRTLDSDLQDSDSVL